jgi:hypothetical protein
MQQIEFIFLRFLGECSARNMQSKKTKKNKLDLLHLVGILFINPRCTETRNSKLSLTVVIFGDRRRYKRVTF